MEVCWPVYIALQLYGQRRLSCARAMQSANPTHVGIGYENQTNHVIANLQAESKVENCRGKRSFIDDLPKCRCCAGRRITSYVFLLIRIFNVDPCSPLDACRARLALKIPQSPLFFRTRSVSSGASRGPHILESGRCLVSDMMCLRLRGGLEAMLDDMSDSTSPVDHRHTSCASSLPMSSPIFRNSMSIRMAQIP
jgi:hypothetical protein